MKRLLVVLSLSLVIGAATGFFIQLLQGINFYQEALNQNIPFHLILMPVVFGIILLIKRSTLYFPVKVSELQDYQQAHHWGRWMSPYQYVMAILSHISGASVGREGVIVLFSSGLTTLFQLNWLFYGPILASVGFAAVIGQFWIAPIFMHELFRYSNLTQKIYSLLGAAVAAFVMKYMGIQHLLNYLDIPVIDGFWSKFWLVLVFAFASGVIIRIYKQIYFALTDFFQTKSAAFKIFTVVILALFLSVSEFRKYQSLGINYFNNPEQFHLTFVDMFAKLFLTVLSTSVGFVGGEFIPLVFAGTAWGHSFFQYWGVNPILGYALGAYLFFSSATKLKWTGYFLTLSVVGFSWWFWVYWLVMIASGASGGSSLYKKQSL